MSVASAVALVRSRCTIASPAAAIVLGSGLGGLARRISNAVRIPYTDIPGFAASSVAGHEGALIHGTLGLREVVALAGRFHVYEGHSSSHSAVPIRVAHALGAPVLIVSNAAGGVRRTFLPGQLMLIRDHIALMFGNPLMGPQREGDTRFPDMSSPYDEGLCRIIRQVAVEQGIGLEDGVYCGLTGPAYETPAEVRMLERMGADAVGMSTVAEVMVARAMGMRVAGISCITNPAAGLALAPIHHDDVIAVTAGAAADFERLVEGTVARL